jgi:hypothetical protein
MVNPFQSLRGPKNPWKGIKITQIETLPPTSDLGEKNERERGEEGIEKIILSPLTRTHPLKQLYYDNSFQWVDFFVGFFVMLEPMRLLVSTYVHPQ